MLRRPTLGGGSRAIRFRPRVAGVGLTAVAVLIAACGPSNPSSSGSNAVLSVLAAASLRDVAIALAPAYQRETGISLEVSTDSSTALRVQIEQGAPADAFLSADTRNPETLAADGLVDGPVIPFARNALAIIVPRDNPAEIHTAADLARPGLKIIAAGDAVPISIYAEQLVGLIAAKAGPQSGYAAAYDANVLSREDNVKAVVAKIELGEGDAAIVYATDAAASKSVRVIPLPPGIAVLASYAGVVPTTARHALLGHAFLAWLTQSAARDILAGFGFSPPS